MQCQGCLQMISSLDLLWLHLFYTAYAQDCITPLASLLTFGTYYAIHDGKFMPASQAFTTLALFSILVRTFSIAPLGNSYEKHLLKIHSLKVVLVFRKLLSMINYLKLETLQEFKSPVRELLRSIVCRGYLIWAKQTIQSWEMTMHQLSSQSWAQLQTRNHNWFIGYWTM